MPPSENLTTTTLKSGIANHNDNYEDSESDDDYENDIPRKRTTLPGITLQAA